MRHHQMTQVLVTDGLFRTIFTVTHAHGALGPVAQSAQQFGEVRRQHAMALFLVLSPALQKKREEAFHEE